VVASVVLIILGVFVMLGIKWFRTRPTTTPKPVIPKKAAEVAPAANVPKPENKDESATPTSSLEDEYKAAKRASRRLELPRRAQKSADQIRESLDARIKIWQEFVDKHENDSPDDPNLKAARKTLRSLKSVRTMY